MPTVIYPKNFPGKRPGLWRATPPAIFLAILGLLGVGLAWRQAGTAFGFGPQISDLILGAYGAKIAARPAVAVEVLAVLLPRVGLATASLSVLMLALLALACTPGLAAFLLWFGVTLQLGLVALLVRGVVVGPMERRRVTAVWQQGFAGFIVAPLSAIPLGFAMLFGAIFRLTLLLALLILAVSAQQFGAASVPARLRPVPALHLVPASLFALVAARLGLPLRAQGFGLVALALAVGLAASARWLTAGRFSPLWRLAVCFART